MYNMKKNRFKKWNELATMAIRLIAKVEIIIIIINAVGIYFYVKTVVLSIRRIRYMEYEYYFHSQGVCVSLTLQVPKTINKQR